MTQRDEREKLAAVLSKIEFALRKDSLTAQERIADARTIVCAEISQLEYRTPAPADGDAHAEIQRLQEAKRRALALADERAKENVALRAALAATASEGVREALDKANYKMGWWLSGALDDPQVCAEMKADINAWFEAHQPGVKITSAAPDTPDEGPDPLGYAKGEKA